MAVITLTITVVANICGNYHSNTIGKSRQKKNKGILCS